MEDIKLLNLEDTVGYLVDRANLASIGATLKGQVDTYDALPEGTVGDVYAVGTAKPYTYYAFTENGWLDIGTWPLAGPKGVPGDRGPQGPAGPVGPKGDKGNQGIAGPSGGGVGVDHITKLDLAVGQPSITYDNTNGATLVKQGKITAEGQDYSVTVDDKIPLVAGDFVTISPVNNKLKISATQNVISVNGEVGVVTLPIPSKTSELTNDSGFITASYHDPEKQNTLVSGDNIKTINNESILGPGNITISGGGTAGVTSLNSKTGAITLAAGNNVTINESGNTLTINATGGGGGGSGTTYEVIDVSSITTLTDDQYNTLISSPFNKVKNGDSIYDLVQETSTQLIYTAPYLNFIYVIVISKSNKKISASTAKCLTNISSYVKNSLDYDVNNSTYALSAYQGKVLNDRLTTVENKGTGVAKLMNQDGTNECTGTIFVGAGLNISSSGILTATGGGGTLYQHTITYNSDKFNSLEDFSGTDQTGSFSISFYSTHGHFENAQDFWTWLISKNSIDVSCGHLWGNIGGDEPFDRIDVAGSSDADKYIKFVAFGGYGDWTPKQWYLKNPDATGLTDTITDGFRYM